MCPDSIETYWKLAAQCVWNVDVHRGKNNVNARLQTWILIPDLFRLYKVLKILNQHSPIHKQSSIFWNKKSPQISSAWRVERIDLGQHSKGRKVEILVSKIKFFHFPILLGQMFFIHICHLSVTKIIIVQFRSMH